MDGKFSAHARLFFLADFDSSYNNELLLGLLIASMRAQGRHDRKIEQIQMTQLPNQAQVNKKSMKCLWQIYGSQFANQLIFVNEFFNWLGDPRFHGWA